MRLILLLASVLCGCQVNDVEPSAALIRDGSQDVVDATLDGAADASVDRFDMTVAGCPEVAPDITDCFRGEAFANCGGQGSPVVGCEPRNSTCLWFTGGCVADGYSPCPPAETLSCDARVCDAAWLEYQWGSEPWGAERHMSLLAEVDVAVSVGGTEVTCACERVDSEGTSPQIAGCFSDASPCTPGPNDAPPNEGLTTWHSHADSVRWGFPSMVTVSLFRPDFTGWSIVVAIDPTGEAAYPARVCASPFTDDASCQSPGPVCALSGRVIIDRPLNGQLDAASVHGRLMDVQFPTFPHVWGAEFGQTEALVIDARF